MCILLPFESNCRTVLLLVSLDTFDITKSTEKSSQGLLSVAGFWNVFYVNCTFSLPHILIPWGMMMALRMRPTLENLLRDRRFM
jgi:hypothetical protein